MLQESEHILAISDAVYSDKKVAYGKSNDRYRRYRVYRFTRV